MIRRKKGGRSRPSLAWTLLRSSLSFCWKAVQRSLNFMLGRQTSCPLACISAAMALKGVGHVEEGTKRATRR
jgi:hypothetical protein